MIEIDGPPRAFFSDRHGQKFFYAMFGLKSDTPAELFQMYANQRAEWEASGHILVWRKRPALEHEEVEVKGGIEIRWSLSFRMCLLPHDVAVGILPRHVEGAPLQYTPTGAML